MNRELTIAHLEVHGWVPYRNIGPTHDVFGVWSRERGYGYAVDTSLRRDMGCIKVWVGPPDDWHVEWDAIPGDMLNTIAARIDAERSWAEAP